MIVVNTKLDSSREDISHADFLIHTASHQYEYSLHLDNTQLDNTQLRSVGVVIGSSMEVGLLVRSMVDSLEVVRGGGGVGMGCRTRAVENHEKCGIIINNA